LLSTTCAGKLVPLLSICQPSTAYHRRGKGELRALPLCKAMAILAAGHVGAQVSHFQYNQRNFDVTAVDDKWWSYISQHLQVPPKINLTISMRSIKHRLLLSLYIHTYIHIYYIWPSHHTNMRQYTAKAPNSGDTPYILGSPCFTHCNNPRYVRPLNQASSEVWIKLA
jgi:hypothetical protein